MDKGKESEPVRVKAKIVSVEDGKIRVPDEREVNWKMEGILMKEGETRFRSERLARVERLMTALREGDIVYLRRLKGWPNLMGELSAISEIGASVDEVLCAMADLIEEVMDS